MTAVLLLLVALALTAACAVFVAAEFSLTTWRAVTSNERSAMASPAQRPR